MTITVSNVYGYPDTVSVFVTSPKGATASGVLRDGSGSFDSTNTAVGVYNWTYSSATGYYTIKRSKANSSASGTYTLSGDSGISGTYTGKQPQYSGYAKRSVWK